MNAAFVIRAARRRLGLSQRGLAALVQTTGRSVAAWETGSHSPSAVTMDRVLLAAGLDLVLVKRLAEEDDLTLRRHLHLSLTQRLRIALGESHALASPARSEAWRELGALSRRGQVVLDPPLAHALWVPVGQVRRPGVSVFHARTAVRSGLVEVRVREGDAARAVIPLMMETGQRVWVLPPGELALPNDTETRLRLADQLLHASAPLDDAGRRRPAHRDPDESGEDWRLLRTKSAVHRPDMRDGRGWRLRASASLAQRMRDEMTG